MASKVKRILSGVRPTGGLHIGNYQGAIKQFIDLQKAGNECFYFVADLHALTEIKGPSQVSQLSHEVVKNYLACGVDPETSTIYRQSDVPEISEMTVLLGNIISIAKLRRCTTYKGKVDARVAEEMVSRGASREEALQAVRKGELRDIRPEEVYKIGGRFSYGLLGYPVLMAADILAVDADLVPVGADQKQHVEFARDYAQQFNSTFKAEALVVPDVTESSLVTVPGIDGSLKMGKSDNNTIALLDDLKTVRKKIARIPTQAEAVGEKTQGTMNLYTLIEMFCPAELADEFLQRYGNPEDKYFGAMKGKLADSIVELLGPIQEKYHDISDDHVQDVLNAGKQRARSIASEVVGRMREAIGL